MHSGFFVLSFVVVVAHIPCRCMWKFLFMVVRVVSSASKTTLPIVDRIWRYLTTANNNKAWTMCIILECSVWFRRYVIRVITWWHLQMETFSAFLVLCEGNLPVTGGFPTQRPVMQSFDVFFDLHLNKQLQTIETLVIWDAILFIMTSL